MKPTVLVIQEEVPHYRVPFFRFLADELGSRDLDLRVVSSSVLPRVDELGFPHQRVLTSRWGLSALGRYTVNGQRCWYCPIAHDLHQLRLRLGSSRAVDESSCSGDRDWRDATAWRRSVIAAQRRKLSDA